MAGGSAGGAEVELRVHQMDPAGIQCSKADFLAFAQGMFPGSGSRAEGLAERMWREAVRVPGHVPYYGDWAGVFVQGVTSSDAVARDLFLPRGRGLLSGQDLLRRRSLSEGQLTEMGRPTTRHPGGHPTARGEGWVAAS